MRLGKLNNDTLEKLVLSKFRQIRPETVSGPSVGLDCATVDLGGELAVLSCDPITSARISHLGALTVHVSCNDAAAAGAEPIGLMVTLLAPPSASEEEIGSIADGLAEAAKQANVDILGGHTEVTDSVTRYVTNCTVLAKVPRDRLLTGMAPGCDVVMTKYAALEGSAIIANDFAQLLTGVDPVLIRQAAGFSNLLSVVPESRIAVRHGAMAMHDVTEGGALGALWEMSFVSGTGLTVFTEAIPVHPATRALCQHLSIDPLRLIGSGSLLIACKDGAELCDALRQAGIPAAIVAKAEGAGVCTSDGKKIPAPGADEIYHLFSL